MAKASDFEGKKQDELFYFVDYSPEEAERVGYSNYSYWGSVIQNFLKHKAAVVCLILFLFLVICAALGIQRQQRVQKSVHQRRKIGLCM